MTKSEWVVYYDTLIAELDKKFEEWQKNSPEPQGNTQEEIMIAVRENVRISQQYENQRRILTAIRNSLTTEPDNDVSDAVKQWLKDQKNPLGGKPLTTGREVYTTNNDNANGDNPFAGKAI